MFMFPDWFQSSLAHYCLPQQDLTANGLCCRISITCNSKRREIKKSNVFLFLSFLITNKLFSQKVTSCDWRPPPPGKSAASCSFFVELKCSQAPDWTTLVQKKNLVKGQTDVGKCQEGLRAVWAFKSLNLFSPDNNVDFTVSADECSL